MFIEWPALRVLCNSMCSEEGRHLPRCCENCSEGPRPVACGLFLRPWKKCVAGQGFEGQSQLPKAGVLPTSPSLFFHMCKKLGM